MNLTKTKQHEVAQREQDLLRHCRVILLSEGYKAVNIDRLAAEVGVSKGTVYNHFANKEEIIMALATQSWQLRQRIFTAASTMAGPSRSRMLAIGAACEHFRIECQDHFEVELWARNHHLWEKTGDAIHNGISQCEQNTMGIVAGIVRDAIARGELTNLDISPEEVVFGFWSLIYGGQLLASTSPSLRSIGLFDTETTMRRHCHHLLTGLNWRPLQKWADQIRTMNGFRVELKKLKF